MEIHHGKHHAAYVTNLNKQIEGKDLDNKSLEEVPHLSDSLSWWRQLSSSIIRAFENSWTLNHHVNICISCHNRRPPAP